MIYFFINVIKKCNILEYFFMNYQLKLTYFKNFGTFLKVFNQKPIKNISILINSISNLCNFIWYFKISFHFYGINIFWILFTDYIFLIFEKCIRCIQHIHFRFK